MPNTEREKQILKILQSKYSVSVKELARSLFASEPSIRRDLVHLEQQKLIIRTHGRAIANRLSADTNTPLSYREQLMYGIKSDIARAASTLIKDGNVIMLDASTTASHMIQYLHEHKDIIVITSSIKTSYMLSKTDIKFFCTGGECINKSLSLTGQSAIDTIKKFNADICFVSCHGLSENGLATDTSVSENEIRSQMLRQSKVKVLLLDSTKINQTFYNNLCDISDFDVVVCDTPLPQIIAEKIKNFIPAPAFTGNCQ